MNRRDALKLMSLAATSMITPACGTKQSGSEHIVTLSFDDGFKKSTIKTADIFEKYGLSACINVIATAHRKDFELPNEYHRWPAGDFDMWNDLQRRGHEIMPHRYKHVNLTKVTFQGAKDLIQKCLDVFSKELDGFKAEECIYNFAHNASTPEIETWLKGRVRAFRTSGPAINPLPYEGVHKLTCISQGPGNIDQYLEEQIDAFLQGSSGWFIFNTHGLDDEGWGPISSVFLDELLGRLNEMEHVRILPVAQALELI